MIINRQTFPNEPFGNINYHYSKKEEGYPNGIIIFMGSYIKPKYRGEGRFKAMLYEFLNSFSEKTTVQVPISNKKIINLFERIGFEKVDKIEYWGIPDNCRNYRWTIDKSQLKNIL